jgi:hypothetical protein
MDIHGVHFKKYGAAYWASLAVVESFKRNTGNIYLGRISIIKIGRLRFLF